MEEIKKLLNKVKMRLKEEDEKLEEFFDSTDTIAFLKTVEPIRRLRKDQDALELLIFEYDKIKKTTLN